MIRYLHLRMLKRDPETERSQQKYERLVTDYYEGLVISEGYNVNDPNEFLFNLLIPHGKGGIVYTGGGEVVEEYEGKLDGGQYSCQGNLFKNGEVFEGNFLFLQKRSLQIATGAGCTGASPPDYAQRPRPPFQ